MILHILTIWLLTSVTFLFLGGLGMLFTSGHYSRIEDFFATMTGLGLVSLVLAILATLWYIVL